MKKMKMYPNRIVGMILLFGVVVTAILLDYPIEIMYLLGSLTFLLVYGIPDFIRFRDVLKKKNLIQVKSWDWLSVWPFIGLVVYWFSDKELNRISITALVVLLIHGSLESIRNYRRIYIITDDAITDVDNNQLVDASDVTEIEMTEDQLVIHTSKYRNDFELKSSVLLTPTWNEVIEKVSELPKSKDS